MLMSGTKYVDAHRDLMSRVREFDGCARVAMTADSVDPFRIHRVEVWRDAEVVGEWRKQANAPSVGEPKHMEVENIVTAPYTFDVFTSLDGFGAASGNWTGYWGKQGPELLEHRLALYDQKQRMVFGANTYRSFAQMLASSTDESEVRDPWVTRMRNLPATVVSTTLEGPLDWPDATVVSGDAVDVVARLKQESEVPLRSHGCLSMYRALMAAGLVDRVQVSLFPVVTGQTGLDPIFQGSADFDLELIESRTLDNHTLELIYRPTVHV